MFLDLYEIEKNSKTKHLFFELMMSEFYYHHIRTNEKFLNEALFRLRRFVESFCNYRMEEHSIPNDNPISRCNEFSLHQKIDLLFNQKILSFEQKDILHDIRMKGNDGIHKNVSLKNDSSSISRNSLLDLLKRVFNLLAPSICNETSTFAGNNYAFEYDKIERSQLVQDFQSRVQKEYKARISRIESEYQGRINEKIEMLAEISNLHKREMQVLEDLYKDEISQLDKQLVIIKSEKEKLEQDFEQDLHNLEKEYEIKVKALNDLYKDSRIKYRKEKVILDLQHKEKVRRIEMKYNRLIHEKETLIEKQLKQLNKLKIVLAGVTSALVLAVGGLFATIMGKNKKALESEMEN
ncbi:MAG: DUF4145 domain-containing protein [Calditrichaeota bacterium]|nr:MAG: DUF4145 domain-containing protein [Calditrichota bacterium]